MSLCQSAPHILTITEVFLKHDNPILLKRHRYFLTVLNFIKFTLQENVINAGLAVFL